jgi:hypothetical protein
MKRTITLILLIVSTFSSIAQEEFIAPSRFLSSCDFTQLTGGVILLRARLEPFPDTLNFILDSGSGGISLDSVTVQYFGLKPVPSKRTIRGIAGIRQVSFIHDQVLKLPELSIDSLEFHVNDYAILTSVYGERIDGIIGYAVLSRYILKIDYDSNKIEFWSKGSLKYPRGGYLLRPQINMLPVQSLRIKDDRTITTRFLFDMGAGLNMMLTSDFIRDSSFMRKKRKFFTKQAEGLGGKIDMSLSVIKEVKIGPYRFRNVPVYIFDDTYNVTSYPYLGGILGNDLLRRFNIILNYDHRDIYLVPNSHYNEPFDYSYTGMELFYENGHIVIGDVAKGSPAEAAGLKEGDIVIAIDRNFNQNMQQYKLAIQNAGDKLKMIIQRGTDVFEYNVKVKSIL